MSKKLSERLEQSYQAKTQRLTQHRGLRLSVEERVVFVEGPRGREVLCMRPTSPRPWQEIWRALRDYTGEPPSALERLAGLVYDEQRQDARPLAFMLVGFVFLAAGLWGLQVTVQAVLDGREYAGPNPRRSMGTRMPADIGAVVFLFLAIVGAGYAWLGLCKAWPALGERRLPRIAAAVVFSVLVLALAITGFGVAAWRLAG